MALCTRRCDAAFGRLHSLPVHRGCLRAPRAVQLDVMRFVIEHGAVLDAPDNSGLTPLARATRNGKTEAVKLLIERGAKPPPGMAPLPRPSIAPLRLLRSTLRRIRPRTRLQVRRSRSSSGSTPSSITFSVE